MGYDEWPQYLDGVRAHSEQACRSFGTNDITEVVNQFNEALTLADAVDWETSRESDFQIVSSTREDDLKAFMRLVLEQAVQIYGNNEMWNSAFDSAELDSFERFRFAEILQQVPGYFSDTPLAARTARTTALYLCSLR